MGEKTLLSVPVGGSAVIDSVNVKGPLRRRLYDLGFLPGAGISCLYSAPSGSPRAYLVRGAVIAVRGNDAKSVILKADSAWD